jgi:dolichyl-phosphate-mannose--protein O-mannosyl transferase
MFRSDWARIAVVVGSGVSLGLWLIAPKPVQFYYHYVMPSVFLLAALALGLSDLRKSGHERIAYGVLVASAGFFALFYKIISAAPLDGPMSFANWAWIAGWR